MPSLVWAQASGVTISETDGSTDVAEGGTKDAFTVVLNSQPSDNVRISFSAPPNSITFAPEPLTFTAGDWNQTQTVTVTAVDDDLAEGIHQVPVSTKAAGGGYDEVSIPDLLVTIADNDATITDNDEPPTPTPTPPPTPTPEPIATSTLEDGPTPTPEPALGDEEGEAGEGDGLLNIDIPVWAWAPAEGLAMALLVFFFAAIGWRVLGLDKRAAGLENR